MFNTTCIVEDYNVYYNLRNNLLGSYVTCNNHERKCYYKQINKAMCYVIYQLRTCYYHERECDHHDRTYYYHERTSYYHELNVNIMRVRFVIINLSVTIMTVHVTIMSVM